DDCQGSFQVVSRRPPPEEDLLRLARNHGWNVDQPDRRVCPECYALEPTRPKGRSAEERTGAEPSDTAPAAAEPAATESGPPPAGPYPGTGGSGGRSRCQCPHPGAAAAARGRHAQASTRAPCTPAPAERGTHASAGSSAAHFVTVCRRPWQRT